MAFSDVKIHQIKSNDMSVIDIRISVFDVGHNLVSISLMQGGTTAVWTSQCSRWCQLQV